MCICIFSMCVNYIDTNAIFYLQFQLYTLLTLNLAYQTADKLTGNLEGKTINVIDYFKAYSIVAFARGILGKEVKSSQDIQAALDCVVEHLEARSRTKNEAKSTTKEEPEWKDAVKVLRVFVGSFKRSASALTSKLAELKMDPEYTTDVLVNLLVITYKLSVRLGIDTLTSVHNNPTASPLLDQLDQTLQAMRLRDQLKPKSVHLLLSTIEDNYSLHPLYTHSYRTVYEKVGPFSKGSVVPIETAQRLDVDIQGEEHYAILTVLPCLAVFLHYFSFTPGEEEGDFVLTRRETKLEKS